MKGHENNKNTLFQSQIMAMEKKMVRDSREIKCMPYVVARIYIAGSLVVWETGVRVRRNCNIFNHAMENVLKGLPDKISCTDIIHKCTSNVHIFLITFKLRDTGTCFIQKIYAPLLFRQALVSFKKYMPPPLQEEEEEGAYIF